MSICATCPWITDDRLGVLGSVGLVGLVAGAGRCPGTPGPRESAPERVGGVGGIGRPAQGAGGQPFGGQGFGGGPGAAVALRWRLWRRPQQPLDGSRRRRADRSERSAGLHARPVRGEHPRGRARSQPPVSIERYDELSATGERAGAIGGGRANRPPPTVLPRPSQPPKRSWSPASATNSKTRPWPRSAKPRRRPMPGSTITIKTCSTSPAISSSVTTPTRTASWSAPNGRPSPGAATPMHRTATRTAS